MQFKIQNTNRNPAVFYNGSKCHYHFINKELAKEFEGQFECLGENTEKYKIFSVPDKKELGNGKSINHIRNKVY